jgi:hypothetical protein
MNFMEGICWTWDKTARIYVPSVVLGPQVQGARKGWMEHSLHQLSTRSRNFEGIISFQKFKSNQNVFIQRQILICY